MIFAEHEHEEVVFRQDRRSGLKAIIAIYSTALGPALGGTRFFPYHTEEEAVADVLELARAMAYKASLAGLPLGGGKAVVIGDPERAKTPELLRTYGELVGDLGGRYITACDVGTTVEDMDAVAKVCDWVTGRSVGRGGAGDSSVLTAYGVLTGMHASARWRWGSDSLSGRRIGVSGVGKVGRRLVEHLVREGAHVMVSDVDEPAVTAVLERHPEVGAVHPDELASSTLDVFAPCALGGALTDATVDLLRAEIVCGAANNQLAHPELSAALETRGILYAPDYLVNAGGLIQVEDERHGFDFDRARARTAHIYQTLLDVYATARDESVSPAAAADLLAERRMAAGVCTPANVEGAAPQSG